MKVTTKLLHLLAMWLVVYTTQAQTGFNMAPLPYAYNALEPYIDAQTMEIHYTRHYAAYVNNLKKALANTDTTGMVVEDLLKNISTYPEAVRNNAGGHYNHTLFWTVLTPNKNTQPSARLIKAITEQYGSLDSLKTLINAEAAKRFGSGWAWLSVNADKKLFVSSTPNQDNPLMNIADKKGTPVLGIDVWEHAYYLKYQNKRGDYLSAIWNVINWDEVSRRYDAAVPKGKFEDWPQITAFHQVMSQTFHPSEEGNLQPIKTRSKELAEKAAALKSATMPAQFNTPEINKAIGELISGSKKLDKMVQSKTDDRKITQQLTDLHEVFHKIVGLCSADHQH